MRCVPAHPTVQGFNKNEINAVYEMFKIKMAALEAEIVVKEQEIEAMQKS